MNTDRDRQDYKIEGKRNEINNIDIFHQPSSTNIELTSKWAHSNDKIGFERHVGVSI